MAVAVDPLAGPPSNRIADGPRETFLLRTAFHRRRPILPQMTSASPSLRQQLFHPQYRCNQTARRVPGGFHPIRNGRKDFVHPDGPFRDKHRNGPLRNASPSPNQFCPHFVSSIVSSGLGEQRTI